MLPSRGAWVTMDDETVIWPKGVEPAGLVAERLPWSKTIPHREGGV